MANGEEKIMTDIFDDMAKKAYINLLRMLNDLCKKNKIHSKDLVFLLNYHMAGQTQKGLDALKRENINVNLDDLIKDLRDFYDLFQDDIDEFTEDWGR